MAKTQKNNLRLISSQANPQICLWTNSYAPRLCGSGKDKKANIIRYGKQLFIFETTS
jgi:hypothetical protein